MKLSAANRRRWFGFACLGAALVMLTCGQTFLHGSLKGKVYLVYWLFCFLFTGLAMVAAIRDFRQLSEDTRKEQRELLQDTLKKIEEEARTRRREGR